MKVRFQFRRFRWALASMVLLLLGTGCVVTGIPESVPAQPTSSLVQANLTALEVIVERLRAGNSHLLQKEESIDIQINDQIAVSKEGRGVLRFPDRLLVELFHDTQMHMADARLEPGGLIFVRIKQTLGTTLAQLNAQAQARVQVDTEYATITTLGEGAEVLICHTPAVTCTVALEGVSQVQAQGETITIKAGEATYIFPGEPPRPAICADMEGVLAWIEKKRGTEAVDPLGKVVAGWPQEPCSEQVQVSVSPTAPAAAPVESLPPSAGMVRIEGGQYAIGRSEPDDFHIAAQQITLDEFWIDQHEVTNAQYQVFVDQTGHPPPEGGLGQENHPVKGVRWDEAADYCQWVAKRLPSEVEWEVAARGPEPEPPLYPWGTDPRAGGLADDLPLIDTYSVGSQAFNKSPFGVYDMAGNVWEWVGEPYALVAEGHQVLRGGRHGLLKDMAYRQSAEPDDQRFLPVTGFRCAADRVAGE